MAGIGQQQALPSDQSTPWTNGQVQFSMGRKAPRDSSPPNSTHKGLSILTNLAQASNISTDRNKMSNSFNEDVILSEATSTMFPYCGRGQDFCTNDKPAGPPPAVVSGAPAPSLSLGAVRQSRPGIINQSMIAAALGKSGRQQLDPSEFPSLGRPPAAPSPMRPPNYISVLHHPTKEEFTIQQEDFPALPGSEPARAGIGSTVSIEDTGSGGNSSNSIPIGTMSLNNSTKSLPSVSSAQGLTSVSSSLALSAGGNMLRSAENANMVVGSGSLVRAHTTNSEDSSAGATTSAPPLVTAASGIQLRQGIASGVPRNMVRDQFGMVGLLAQLRSSDSTPDHNLHIITNQGVDLTQLGLNLTSSQELYPTFGSPWADYCVTRPQDMAYNVPQEYLVQVYIRDKLPAPPIENMNQETLFWIFYNCTKEQMQLLAAKELHKRDWRWIKSERLWVTRSGQGFEKLANERGERGVYNFWDVTAWQTRQRQLVIPYDQIDNAPPSFPNLPNLPQSAGSGVASAIGMAVSNSSNNTSHSDLGSGNNGMHVL